MNLTRPGDIITFVYKKDRSIWGSPLSWAISKVQGDYTTHSGIVFDPKKQIIIDAYYPKVRIIKLCDMIDPKNYKWETYRVVGASGRQRYNASRIAKSYIGSKYDLKSWISLAKALLIERWIKLPIRDRYKIRDNPKRLFCQELVTQCYIDAGFNFASYLGFNDPSAILPKDIHRFKNRFRLIEQSE